jgi:hypothetical protein
MSISRLIEPGDAVAASDVDLNFSSFSTDLADVTSDNIESSSIRTRHIAVTQGSWKEVTVHLNAASITQNASDALMVPLGTTATITKKGQMVLVIGTAQFESTATPGSATCTGEIQLKVGPAAGPAVLARTMKIRTVGPEKLQISTIYAFQATANKHLIELWFKGGGTTCTVHNPELQIIAVRG